MSEVRLNITDARYSIHGTLHGSVAEAVIAALSAEPETIAELEAALERFIKRLDSVSVFESFSPGENFEPWDAGLVVADLAGRLAVIDSSYSVPGATGEVRYHDGTQSTNICLPYRIPDDWQLMTSVLEYEAARERRRRERAAASAVDARAVLYGAPLIEFIVNECLAARERLCQAPRRLTATAEQDSHETVVEDLIADIHARWLITPRADLSAVRQTVTPVALPTRTPREIILAKLDFIDFDLQHRVQQWSLLREGPPPLSRDSFAYRFAGFGTHEYVIYYHLVRHLLNECWQRVESNCAIDASQEVAHLEALMHRWLNEPQREFDGRTPAALIESERRRIPILMSAKETIIDENCELCRLMADEMEDFGPVFWFLDGSDLDNRFEFSNYPTRAEWEAEQRHWREFNEEFDREWAAAHGEPSEHSNDGAVESAGEESTGSSPESD